MIKYFQNNQTGALIALNLETKEINELEEIKPQGVLETIGGGVERTKKERRIKKEKAPAAERKIIGNRKCAKCGKIVPPGKYLCKGMCSSCYNLELYHKKHGGKSRVKSEPTSNKYECIDCYKKFKSPLDIKQAKCPVNPAHQIVQK